MGCYALGLLTSLRDSDSTYPKAQGEERNLSFPVISVIRCSLRDFVPEGISQTEDTACSYDDPAGWCS